MKRFELLLLVALYLCGVGFGYAQSSVDAVRNDQLNTAQELLREANGRVIALSGALAEANQKIAELQKQIPKPAPQDDAKK